ncbi:MAG: hypothetical protein LUG26_07415 [Ruminococcus sp.]|nr:hypothetical protein [Ruminococcus sp.]
MKKFIAVCASVAIAVVMSVSSIVCSFAQEETSYSIDTDSVLTVNDDVEGEQNVKSAEETTTEGGNSDKVINKSSSDFDYDEDNKSYSYVYPLEGEDKNAISAKIYIDLALTNITSVTINDSEIEPNESFEFELELTDLNEIKVS